MVPTVITLGYSIAFRWAGCHGAYAFDTFVMYSVSKTTLLLLWR